MPRRFGLSAVVERQIELYRQRARKGVRLTTAEFAEFMELVIRRPDSAEIFREMGAVLATKTGAAPGMVASAVPAAPPNQEEDPEFAPPTLRPPDRWLRRGDVRLRGVGLPVRAGGRHRRCLRNRHRLLPAGAGEGRRPSDEGDQVPGARTGATRCAGGWRSSAPDDRTAKSGRPTGGTASGRPPVRSPTRRARRGRSSVPGAGGRRSAPGWRGKAAAEPAERRRPPVPCG